MFPQCRPHHVARSLSTNIQPATHVSRRQVNNKVRWRTSSLKTPSRSPTARTTVSHLFKKRVLQETLYRNAIMHTELRSERVASTEARPVQCDVNNGHWRACGNSEDKNPRHCRHCKFLISAWPYTALGIRVSTAARPAARLRHISEPVQVKACVLKRPCWRAGVARPDVLAQCDKVREAKLGE